MTRAPTRPDAIRVARDTAARFALSRAVSDVSSAASAASPCRSTRRNRRTVWSRTAVHSSPDRSRSSLEHASTAPPRSGRTQSRPASSTGTPSSNVSSGPPSLRTSRPPAPRAQHTAGVPVNTDPGPAASICPA
ncbi:hypothetical protein [Actinoplanes philippinensis]|uniref:hypothetical protein n=1 Tax=Actinoplanes philippinensis TaxID=35752 RepID=UPI003409436D